ncbi:hypothetical protein BDU57DRAFT_483929 [Ampelomyces quisqualis]|uniref:WW domain-containing protein n=1 Tax=Ampelomyces quisqualis TaxID=50730 RepID=A0A6A5QBM0_AMPQU|nr:hypothetical protein BDU57DRAFT_483929 [Ampelomyces quisqualis]
MADVPARPPAPAPPLPAGWTEHKAPAGHTYYYHKETNKSTYKRPTAPPSYDEPLHKSVSAQPAQDSLDPRRQIQDLIFGGAPQRFPQQHGTPQHHARGGYRGGSRGGHSDLPDKRRERDDKPKHRSDIPNCAPWVLVKTKFGRRFVWNKATNESFWKFPPDVLQAVVEFDRKERERKERRERGEPSDVDEDDAMADIEAELAAAEEEVEIVEVDGEAGMEDDEEYEEVDVTDDEGEEPSSAPKRQRTDGPSGGQPQETEDDDLAWQLAQMEEMERQGGHDEEYYEQDDPVLSEDDCKALFKELLEDARISPYTPWDKILQDGVLFDDGRYKALPNMKARNECFNEWSREKMQSLKEEKAKLQKLDPKIPYLALLDRNATPKLYWPEFRRKYKKEPEMKDGKLSDKDKEKLYRDHIKRLGMRSSDLKSDLSALLRTQPLVSLNRSTTLDTLPSAVLTDLRYISLPPSTRDSMIETYISTLPPAPEGPVLSAEEEAARAKKWAERDRREKALADRERRVQQEKRKQERDLAYGKGRLREEEAEIERAMKVGKDGLKGHLD